MGEKWKLQLRFNVKSLTFSLPFITKLKGILASLITNSCFYTRILLADGSAVSADGYCWSEDFILRWRADYST